MIRGQRPADHPQSRALAFAVEAERAIGDGAQWFESPNAHLSIPSKDATSGSIVFDVGAFLARPDSRHSMTIPIGDQAVANTIFTTGHNRQAIEVPIRQSPPGNLDVELMTNPRSPKFEGVSRDPRKPGVALYGFTVNATRSG
jgi:hypothetical protein